MTTSTLEISKARKQFTRLDERLVEDNLIWITRRNQKAFAIVNTDLMQAVLETLEILRDPEALRMLQQSLDDIRAERLHDHEDVKKEFLDEETGQHPVDQRRQGGPKKAPVQSKSRNRRKSR
jgi:PHD/YefM family antitoxin component YafN of YafNO toxin-antitoxin module